MKAISFSKYEQVLKSGDENIADLPVVSAMYQDGTPEIISCWELSFWERIKVLFLGKIFIHITSHNMVPIKLSQDYAHVERINRFYQESEKYVSQEVQDA